MSRAKDKVYVYEEKFEPKPAAKGLGNTHIVGLERSLKQVEIPEEFKEYEEYVVNRAVEYVNPRIVLKKEFISTTIISIDIETNGNKLITEIGIIIYRDHKVIAKTSMLANGVKELPPIVRTKENASYFDVEALTSLKVINIGKHLIGQAEITSRFLRYIEPYVQGDYKIIYWGGSELTLLGIKDYINLDMYMYYKSWLELNDKKRNSGTSLSDAVKDLFGHDFEFEYHRALTDATATLGVALCISNLKM
jgi:hypothetical protein